MDGNREKSYFRNHNNELSNKKAYTSLSICGLHLKKLPLPPQ